MLLLLTLLFLVLTILCVCVWDDEDLALAPGALFLIFTILTIIFTFSVVGGRVIDSKIEMYMEENENIEADLNLLVEQYMKYESDTYGELKNESGITLISLYPELKADVLVTKQIEVYIANNEKIKELKENKIDLSVNKWWLYFGK